MAHEGKTDAFERRYMGAFQALASEHGIAVRYERDRAARDVGVHLVQKMKSGTERTTGSLVWFQMKGIQKETLSEDEFRRLSHVKVRLKVADLQLWFRLSGPTYLAVYIESVDMFLVMDLTKHVQDVYGRSVFELEQQTVTVNVPTQSVLDSHAFRLLLRRGTVEEWQKVLEADPEEVRLCERDYTIIWCLGTAGDRRVEHRMDVVDWQSKMRGEVAFLERTKSEDSDDWKPLRQHWQFGLGVHDIEETYPYLTFDVFDEERQFDIEYWGNEDDEPAVTLRDGSVIYGENCAWEYFSFEFRPTLNDVGKRLFQMIMWLIKVGLVEQPDPEEAHFIDVAPWHYRSV